MSSISDALKKAQKNRAGESLGRVAPPPAVAPARGEIPSPQPSPSRGEGVEGVRLSPTIPVVGALALGLVLVLVASRDKIPSPRPSPSRGEGVEGVRQSPARGEGVDAGVVSSIRDVVVDQDPPASAKVAGGNSDSSAPSPLEGEGRGEGSVPVEQKAADEPLPVLSGTFYSEQNPVAIIDGFALKEGETAGSFRVVKILPRGVMLRTASGKDVELRLK